MLKRFEGTLLATLLLVATASTAAAVPGLNVTIAEDKSFLGEADDAIFQVAVTNETAASLFLPRWQVPTLGIEANLFDVRLNGKPVEYVGKLVKRAVPGPEDYVEIRAGETLAGAIELSSVYEMDRPGEYTVQYRAFVEPLGSRPSVLRSNAVGLWRDGNEDHFNAVKALAEQPLDLFAGERPLPGDTRALTPSFVSCSSSRQSSLVSALSQAQTYAQNSANYLNAGSVTARYTTWFGTYNSSRYTTVRSHFSSILSAIQNQRFTFYCTCTDSSYAFVYKNRPWEMWLCNAFWAAPLSGTDSKGGTIIHETSHYNATASTDDWAYGQSACRSLATSSPTRAVDNADSHEYFAENTPAL